MHHLLRRIVSKRVDTLVSDALFSSFLAKQHFTASSLQKDVKCLKRSIPGNFVKWGSLGFCRTSRFATGFEPLKHKPLDSIMDIERVKDRSAEEIASVWDDFHLGRGHIGTSMKASLYHLLEQRAANCRYFVIPL